MAYGRAEVQAFILGELNDDRVREEIEREIDDPQSLVCQIARRFAELNRQMMQDGFDDDGLFIESADLDGR